MKRAGTIIERGGHYHLRYIIEGLQFQTPLNTRSLREAEKMKEEFMRHRQGGLEQYESFLKSEIDRIRRFRADGESCTIAISGVWEAFICSAKRPKANRLTLCHYESAWKQFVAGLPKERKNLGQITRQDADARMEAIYKAGLSQGTADKHLIYLTAILNAMQPDGATNPFEGVIARGADNAEDLSYIPVSLEQSRTLLASVVRQKRDRIKEDAFLELYGVFVTLAYTGLRLGDASGLLIEEVHFDRNILIVRANKTSRRKSGKAAYAKIGLHPALCCVLREQIGKRESGPVFRQIDRWGKDRQSSWIQIIFKRAGVVRRADSANGMRNLYGASSFRHALEDRMRQARVSQTAINVTLCHSDRSMASVYSTITDEELYEAILAAYPDIRPNAQGKIIQMQQHQAG